MDDDGEGRDSNTVSEQNDLQHDEPHSPEESLDSDPQDFEDVSYSEGSHKIQYEELFSLISSHIEQFSAETHTPASSETSRASHNAVQREVWRDLIAKATADDTIPNALFDPPRTYIRVCVASWPRSGHYCCPCDLGGSEAHAIEITAARGSPHGITKGIFLQQIADALYGRDPSSDESDVVGPSQDQDYFIGGEEDRPIIDHLSFMTSGGAVLGDIYALTRFFKEEEEELEEEEEEPEEGQKQLLANL